jgi:hypothetical protein
VGDLLKTRETIVNTKENYEMTVHAVLNPALPAQIEQAAAAAGLEIAATEQATSFAGEPTTRFTLTLKGDHTRTLTLELSNSFDPTPAESAAQVAIFLTETAGRLKNPQTNTLLTLGGIPLTYSGFQWPFHESTAGADTSVVHGQINLADGTDTPLHAKIAAAMTVTFREIVKIPEQPFAESFILNAVRKTLDQGQLELVKSGNRQPVPVTTRYYTARGQKFVFNDTTEPQRREFLMAKAFWMSGVLGGGAPVWLLDPRDAQYLNTTVADLKISLEGLAKEGVVTLSADPAYVSASEALMAQRGHFEEELAEALRFIKPTFNEEMRAGHTNM